MKLPPKGTKKREEAYFFFAGAFFAGFLAAGFFAAIETS